jgi:hypothetical protein
MPVLPKKRKWIRIPAVIKRGVVYFRDMETAAVVIGIDDYKGRPLTSGVNDALAFRKALIEHGLVSEGKIKLLTSPLVPDAVLATSRNIRDILYGYYKNGEGCDRFYFHFAGHGLLAYFNSAKTRTRTLLLPCDIEDLDKDGALVIDFTELMDVLSLAGPKEQFYFVDACRDMDYERQPGVGELGWSGVDPSAERSQFCIYAVSPLGKAKGVQGGLGVMTSHIVHALQGQGVALDFDSQSYQYVVTMRSVLEYAREKVKKALESEPLWAQKYQLPTPQVHGPEARAIREVTDMRLAPFAVHIDPEFAADQTEVKLVLGMHALESNYCYPLNKNHGTIHLQPQRHLLLANSSLGLVVPSRQIVDLREQHEQVVRVFIGPPRPEPPAKAPDSGGMPPLLQHLPTPTAMVGSPEPVSGTIRAESLEPQVEISIQSLEAPYTLWSGLARLEKEVSAGPYRVQFRLGQDVFNEREIYVRAGEAIVVQPTVAMTPLVQEAMGAQPETSSIVVSESIGPIQAALLSTMLPIIGIKPFDVHHELFSQFEALVEPRDPVEFGDRPLSIVLAVDGNAWSIPVTEVLQGMRCTVRQRSGNEIAFLEPRQLPRPTLLASAADAGRGLQRVFQTVAAAPPEPFSVQFNIPNIGVMDLASASLPQRATVITMIFRPDGSIDIGQNLLRLPGRIYPNEPPGPIDNFGNPYSYGSLLRAIQIGQKLYQSGELLDGATNSGFPDDRTFRLLRDALYCKWLDPILGCMGYYASARALRNQSASSALVYPWLLEEVAKNLKKYFYPLPDSRVIYGLAFPNERDAMFGEMLDIEETPILAESVYELARYAVEKGREGAAITEIARTIQPNQPWCQSSRAIVRVEAEAYATVSA